ncbi:MAG TPA: hypothetical protein DCP20_01700 [Coriobacteriia bacterium]|nr:MAG: hypothetical protein XD74_0295 [Actinobacteria bacterium 66_15]HAL29418.1 hypothetical protein [Coriobacteriia bacterium]
MQADSTQATTRTRRHGPLGAAALALFLAWRLLLTRLWRRCVHGARALLGGVSGWSAQWRRIHAYHFDTAHAWNAGPPETRSTAAAFGLRAFVGGLAIASGLASAGGDPFAGVLLAVAVESLWAAARLTILALLVPHAELERGRLLIVYTAALIPYALALGPVFQLGALAASGILTARGLVAAGASKATTRRAAGWAFGGQAAILMLGVAGRAALALVASA